MKIKTRLLRLSANQLGRDFVVGDIHGHVEKLHQQLNALGFDFDKDRLICVGDLIDRGPQSPQALALLNEPWFYSVIGNHEHLMVSAMKYKNSEHRMTWLGHGGEWIASSNPGQWAGWFEQIENLPLAIEVTSPTGVHYGVIHADFPYQSWKEVEELEDDEALRTIWSRASFQKRSEQVVQDIDWIIHGHNVHEGELVLGNRIYIDQGAYLGNPFIIKELV
ncbi:metallophosphoesterase [Oceanobacter mangrovi]|uniref:metallophosphoesterase n=1 Tax=Oceanobacter mangrovi TaxID=2862510 RepID=UPI001C8DD41C|nr:metallophosphoesterase [Oceanobacter mangrovi]